MRRSAVVISLVASAGVILLGVLQGIVVAVALAILLFFRRNWWPHGAVLGMVDGVAGWHSIDALPRRRQSPGHRRLPLGGAAVLRQRGHLPPAGPRARARAPSRSWVVLQCEAITDVDVTAAAMLEQLDDELNAAGVHLAFAELRGRLQDLILRYGLLETLDRDHFYPTLETAITARAAKSRTVDARAALHEELQALKATAAAGPGAVA